MKKLLLLLAFCGVVHAEVIATLRNRSGGHIVLTDVVTDNCSGYVGTVYSTSENNRISWGCWFVDQVMVHVRWLDGDTRAYPIDAFTVDEEAVRRLKDRRKNNGRNL